MINVTKFFKKIKNYEFEQKLSTDPQALLEEQLLNLFSTFNPIESSIRMKVQYSNFTSYIFVSKSNSLMFDYYERYLMVKLDGGRNAHTFTVRNKEVLKSFQAALRKSKEYLIKDFVIKMAEEKEDSKLEMDDGGYE